MAINKKLIHFKTKENFLTQLENDNILDSSICFIKDTKEIYTHGQLYKCDLEGTKEEIYNTLTPIFEDIYRVIGMDSHIGEDGEIIPGTDLKQEVLDEFMNLLDDINDKVDTKVDKVAGKQLSTEDFTTTLKNGLESLLENNPSLVNKVNSLKNTLDTLTDSSNTTEVIDTFNEIEAFLEGLTNTETLLGVLQEYKADILSEVSNSNVASADKLIIKELTNEDLNDIKNSYFSNYYALGTNTCKNVPENINALKYFNLQLVQTSNGRYCQILIDGGGNIFKRIYGSNNTWERWKRMLSDDDIQVLTEDEYDALTTKKANTIYLIKE